MSSIRVLALGAFGAIAVAATAFAMSCPGCDATPTGDQSGQIWQERPLFMDHVPHVNPLDRKRAGSQ